MTYFTNDFITFFKQLEKNNKREWFHAHKEDYEQYVKDPFENFVGEVILAIRKRDAKLLIEPRDAIFRINRDIRFSKDKTPYKINRSAAFMPGGRKDWQTPGFYFRFGPKENWIGGGMHHPDKDSLQKLRRAVQRHYPEFKKVFGKLGGEKNKIVPKEFKDDLAKMPELANKQFYYMAEYKDPKILLKKDLLKFVIDHYVAAKKINEFMKKAVK